RASVPGRSPRPGRRSCGGGPGARADRLVGARGGGGAGAGHLPTSQRHLRYGSGRRRVRGRRVLSRARRGRTVHRRHLGVPGGTLARPACDRGHARGTGGGIRRGRCVTSRPVGNEYHDPVTEIRTGSRGSASEPAATRYVTDDRVIHVGRSRRSRGSRMKKKHSRAKAVRRGAVTATALAEAVTLAAPAAA